MWTPIPEFCQDWTRCGHVGLKLTEKYPHLKLIEEANNEADEAREEVEFWEEDNIRLTFGLSSLREWTWLVIDWNIQWLHIFVSVISWLKLVVNNTSIKMNITPWCYKCTAWMDLRKVSCIDLFVYSLLALHIGATMWWSTLKRTAVMITEARVAWDKIKGIKNHLGEVNDGKNLFWDFSRARMIRDPSSQSKSRRGESLIHNW